MTRTGASGQAQSRCHEAEGWGAEGEELGVEAPVAVGGPPGPPGLLPHPEDLELAPRVAAVRRVERGPVGLGPGGRALEVGVGLEAVGGLVDAHLATVQA